MKYYINLPTDDKVTEYQKFSARFEATLIVEAIKRLPVHETSKKQITKAVLKAVAEST